MINKTSSRLLLDATACGYQPTKGLIFGIPSKANEMLVLDPVC